MMRHINIAFMLPSAMLAAGMAAVIKRMPEFSCSVVEINEGDYLDELAKVRPAMLIVDPVVTGVDWDVLKSSSSCPVKLIAVLTQQMPKSALKWFDDTISIYDSLDDIAKTLHRNTSAVEDDDRGKDLSPREKEVIVGIVKGLSNKEIASAMNVSVNTVMTHRRNIASKLHIHTPAGLTIYAIVSNLVKLEDIKSDMGKL